MGPNPSEESTILRSAWQLHADYSMNADMSVRRHWRLREWVIIISVIATLLAILSDIYRTTPFLGQFVGQALRIFLIIVPITGSVVLALANKFQEGERWLALRNGAEDVLRVIYLYRTILSKNPNRDQWLEERLIEIRREALQKVKGNLALTPYTGLIPALRSNSDQGFDDLLAVSYIDCRLNFQVKQYAQKINDVQKIRTRLQITIFALGGVGSLLAALSNISGFGGFSIWVAFSTALAAALGSWLELRQLDWRVLRGMSSEDRQKLYIINTEKAGSQQNAMDDPLESTVAVFSHIINELSIARDHWISLSSENRTINEYYELVLVVERVLWGKDFTLGIQTQTAITEQNIESSQDNQAGIEMYAGSVEGNGDKELPPETKFDFRSSKTKNAQIGLALPRVVVLMSAGRKLTPDGLRIDFDNVFSTLIEPSLLKAGFSVYRWTESKAVDSVQELLVADIVVVDISVDDPDVFYNMGIRHAFRKRGIVHIREAQSRNSFGTFHVRTTEYHCNKYGRVDSSMQKLDEGSLANMVSEVWRSNADIIDSPLFGLLTGLSEPDRRSLRTPLAVGFWQEYNEWKERVTVAQRQKRIGDILLLTEEIRNPLIKEEAIGEAGQALKYLGRNELALSQFRKGLEINPHNMIFRREEAFNLNRLGRVDEAIIKLKNLLVDFPMDTEAIAFLGRIYKEMWYDSWKWIKEENVRIKTAFESYHWLIQSLETYLKGYRLDLDQFYPGVNALTLGTLLIYLADQYDDKTAPDPRIQRIREILPELRLTLSFALENQAQDETADYWTLTSLAELRVLTAEVQQEVTRAYRKALAASHGNQFYLQSSLAQLQILQLLNLREKFVQAGIDVIGEELRRIRKETNALAIPSQKGKIQRASIETQKRDGMVFLFTGYMISNSRKKENHLPPEKEHELKQAIATVLDKYGAGPDDLAVTTGMDAGSQILFVECCAERGVRVQVHLPVAEAPYVRDFVSPGGDAWVERFYKMRNHPLVDEFYQPDCVGLPRRGDNVYERNNRWALYSALVRGIDKVRLIAVWDAKNETVSDLDVYLVDHMVGLMRDMGGIVEQINPAKLVSFVPSREAIGGRATARVAVKGAHNSKNKHVRR